MSADDALKQIAAIAKNPELRPARKIDRIIRVLFQAGAWAEK